MPGLKRQDIKNCSVCDKGLMHCGNPMSYRLKIDTLVADAREINKEAGMEQFFSGNVALATVFSADPELYKQLDSREHLICMDCYMYKLGQLLILPEKEDPTESGD